MNKNILILVNHDVVVYNFRRELIEELIRLGYRVYISCPYGERIEPLKVIGCEYIQTLVDRRSINPLIDLKLLLTYIKLIRKIKPTVVLAYTIKPNMYGGIAARLMNVPCINNITGLGSSFLKDSFLRRILILMYKVALKKSHCVFFQNKDNIELALNNKIIKGKHRLIPGSGVNLTHFQKCEYPSEGNGLVFNYIGRIMADKGINEYIEAASAIKQKHPNTTFNIIGFVEPTEMQYKAILEGYEKQGIIKYLGNQMDIRPYIKASHCIIHPSKYGEGMSNVLLESAAIGRPLIASNIPGCKEIINEGVNGYLFAEGSTKEIINKIERFIALSFEEKKQMGTEGRKKVECEFDRNIVVQAYMEEIERCACKDMGNNKCQK